VTMFPGLWGISGAHDALGPVEDLQATIFVDTLRETHEQLDWTGWTAEGSLGSSLSLQARDPGGALFEFVETGPRPGDGRQPS
jgi:hypothetical protein